MVEDITAAARRNPMQAVAVGASVACPLLRLARAIPLPVLMIGAGLFFAGSKTGQSAVQKASDMASDLSDEVRRRGHDLSDQVGASVASARDATSDAIGKSAKTSIPSFGQTMNACRLNENCPQTTLSLCRASLSGRLLCPSAVGGRMVGVP
jgi:hypothetical protein